MSAFNIPIPFRTLCWLCLVQSSVCPYFGILAENPFPRERGYITGATAPRPSKDACSQSHKATARCSGTNGWRPVRGLRPKARMLWLLAKSFARCKTSRASNTRHPVFITKSFFDRLIIYLLYNGIVWGLSGDCLRIVLQKWKMLKFLLKRIEKSREICYISCIWELTVYPKN